MPWRVSSRYRFPRMDCPYIGVTGDSGFHAPSPHESRGSVKPAGSRWSVHFPCRQADRIRMVRGFAFPFRSRRDRLTLYRDARSGVPGNRHPAPREPFHGSKTGIPSVVWL